MSWLLVDIAAGLAAGLFLLFIFNSWHRKAVHLPPGPPGLPLLGNLLQIPRKKEFEAFRDMGDIYGDLVTLRVPGHIFMLLNSRKAIADLLDARSAIYSDRPSMVMCTDLVGWTGTVVLANNTPRFRNCRKLLRKGLGPSAAQSFIPFLNRQSAFYLENLQKRPDAFTDIFKRTAAAISMKIAYGYDGIQEDEELYVVGCLANHYFTETAVVGTWFVDMLPILRHVPRWFPLAYFQRYANRAKPIVDESVNKPFEETKRHVKLGTAGASFTSMLLGDAKGDAETEDCIKWASTGIFLGQLDTTTSALSWFFLAMALHPEVQAKAQAEIDKVIGDGRLPRVEDRDALPYVSAVMQETFRWHPVVPLIPRALSKDDEYRGYFMPAKTTLIANVWAIMHDRSVYPDEDKFRPERFTEDGAPDCLNVAFGFGRRVCPGILIAQAHVFLSIATTLATFNISKARDSQDNIVEPTVEDTPGAINFPQPFKVSVEPRSAAAAELIRKSAEHSRTLPERLEIFSLDA
ncbi:cytochrome P450 [Phanerochaete sordida]|uniref:Cytochrome P450 n=1 Tax=Phanerochaete sordida TaxID=48140 RepID=A0A9P3G2G0_9APHY|nr:cytochrome P450 [Phanerochaete sordida]